jgi:hypothetical protein
MKKRQHLRGFIIRFTLAVVMASSLTLAAAFPLPQWTWPLVHVLSYPALTIMGTLFPLGCFPGSMSAAIFWQCLVPSAALSMPIYLGALYIPNLALWSLQRAYVITIRALEQRVQFIAYSLLALLVVPLPGSGLGPNPA